MRTSSKVSEGLLVLCPKREVGAEHMWAEIKMVSSWVSGAPEGGGPEEKSC